MRGKVYTTVMTIALVLVLALVVLAPVCHSASEGEETTGTPAGSNYLYIWF